jgi:hypothetical protein
LRSKPAHTSSLCNTANEEESLPAAQKKKKRIMKIKGFDPRPKEACSSIFTTSVSKCVKERKCQG